MSSDELQSVHAKLDEIRVALVGNVSLGHKGLVSRVEHVEREVENHTAKLIAFGGIVTGGVFVLQFLKAKIFG